MLFPSSDILAVFSAIAPALLLMALALSAISEAFEDMSSEFLEIFSALESICAANESAEPPAVIFRASIAALLEDMDFVFSEMAALFAFIDSLFSAIFSLDNPLEIIYSF